MWTLRSGDKNNDAAMDMIQKYPDRAAELKNEKTLKRMAWMVFKGPLNDKTANTIMVGLTLGDELSKNPVDLDTARLLWFALQVNLHQGDQVDRITSMEEARTAWAVAQMNKMNDAEAADAGKGEDITDHDYVRRAAKRAFVDGADYRYAMKMRKRVAVADVRLDVTWVPQGTDVTIYPQVSFFKSGGANYCCLSAAPFMGMEVNGERFNVPKAAWRELIRAAQRKGKGRLAFTGKDHTDQLRAAFDLENHKDVVIAMMMHGGYEPDPRYRDITLTDDYHLDDQHHLVMTLSSNSDYEALGMQWERGWTQMQPTEWVLLQNQDYVVILSGNHKHAGVLSR